jgi:hypothetical protein
MKFTDASELRQNVRSDMIVFPPAYRDLKNTFGPVHPQ